MKTFAKDELNEILQLHSIWLRGEDGGVRANLSGSNLRYSNLRYSDLRYSNLSGSDLRYSDLSGSDLSGSDLSGSDLSGSDLSGSNLSGSDLRYSNLSGSDLRYSNLSGSEGQNSWIKTLGSDIWQIVYTFDRLQIGCENHLITEWWEFDDDKISEMDNQALEWWSRWKPILQAIIANNPAQATGKEQI